MIKVNAGVAIVAALFLFLTVPGYAVGGGPGLEEEKSMTDREILPVLERHRGELMSIPGVTGVAEGRCGGKPCIKVYVTRKTPQAVAKIPVEIEGFPVSVEETGEFKPLPEPQA